ncbi:cytochrome b5 domain-containing protein [Sedimentibacter saalensis]|uniref:cytochrome b5 domain-containing protein n=1 Tax=Sedimentibacter saalensis TaxID=130788 RepID=UPI003CC90AFF
MKRVFLLCLTLILILFSGCSNSTNNENINIDKTFTIDELATYNGKNGNSAYISVDGIVYDVTNVPQWKNGTHNGFEAGKDLTDEIKTISPHGISKLKGIPVVGKLAE